MTVTRRTLVPFVVMGLGLLAAFAPLEPLAVERWFSTRAYPIVQRALTPISNLVPFAVLDVLGAVAIVAMFASIAMVIRASRDTWRRRHPAPVIQSLARLGAVIAVIYLVFLLVWGLNYRRLPMRERLLIEPAQPSGEAVLALGLDAAAQLNALHDDAHRHGWSERPSENEAMRRAFSEVQRELSDAPPAEPGRLKKTLLGPYFRWTGVDGMINPFGLEVLANPDLLPFERPSVAAHEWAHLAGYADEAEASFVGWLTCVQADVPAQYSGWLFLYWQVRSEADESARTRLAAALATGPRRDVEAIRDRLLRGELPWLRAAGWRVYDQYLKVNRVEAGVRSYGEVLTLILGARFEKGWMPVRRPAPGDGRAPGP